MQALAARYLLVKLCFQTAIVHCQDSADGKEEGCSELACCDALESSLEWPLHCLSFYAMQMFQPTVVHMSQVKEIVPAVTNKETTAGRWRERCSIISYFRRRKERNQ